MLESKAYQTYYAFASREKAPKPKYIRKKADSDTSPKKKLVQATKGTRLKSKAKVAKPDKKKQPAKKTKAKGLDVLSEVALTEAEQIKLVTPPKMCRGWRVGDDDGVMMMMTDRWRWHSGSGVAVAVDGGGRGGDGVDRTSGTDEGTGTIPWVPGVPPYESESDKVTWGDSDDEDNDDDDDGDNDDDRDSDDHDDDSDDERTESDRDEIPDPKLTNVDQTEHEEEEFDDEFYEEEEEEEENIDDEETMYDKEDDEVTKELYDDVNVNLANEDTDMTIVDQGASDQQNLLNLDNPSLVDNEIASLMDTTGQHATVIPEITSSFTTTVPPPPSFLHTLQQEATPAPTPTTFITTTSTNQTVTLPEIPNFISVFKFDQRVSAIESELSELKQTNQFAEAVSSIPGIIDSYLPLKMKEAVDVAAQLQTNQLREEAQGENQ
ncbi:hypothetical protein Tco_0902335 [Tanacetum coccineum]